jgi:hypothetical protein
MRCYYLLNSSGTKRRPHLERIEKKPKLKKQKFKIPVSMRRKRIKGKCEPVEIRDNTIILKFD